MAKLGTTIGFAISQEKSSGVFIEAIEERYYVGEIFKNTMSSYSNQSVNPNLSLSNKFSMLVDSFSKDNHQKIRYAVFWGSKWKVTNIEIEGKRLILTIGGKYNE